MTTKSTVATTRNEQNTLGMYVTGFVFSVTLTLLAYLLTTHHTFTRDWLIAVIIGLALVQFIVQLVFFLDLGRDSRPRWKLLVFWFMIAVVMILVFGSLWIMNNLNYRMMPQQVQQYLNSQDGL